MNLKLFLLLLLGIFCIYNGADSNYIVLFWIVTGLTTAICFIKNIISIVKDLKKANAAMYLNEN